VVVDRMSGLRSTRPWWFTDLPWMKAELPAYAIYNADADLVARTAANALFHTIVDRSPTL
jgi:hypothetical protein